MAKMTLIVPFCLASGSGMFVERSLVEGET